MQSIKLKFFVETVDHLLKDVVTIALYVMEEEGREQTRLERL